MKIAIDLSPLSYHITGIERYALCITEELIKIDKKNEYILIFRDKVDETFKKYIEQNRFKIVIISGNNKLLFREIQLVKTLYSIKADKYLFLSFMSPILFKRKGIINTIHDMGAWDASYSMTLKQKIYYRIGGYISSINSEEIITVSEFSKKRICEILKIDEKIIHVIPSGISDKLVNNENIDYEIIRKKYSLPKKYIMSLSTIEPKKNMELLLKTYEEINNKVPYELVLVGRLGWKMGEVIIKYNHNKKIHFTDYIPDYHIKQIYKNALCFVFPSKYEGFGLPPLEALSVGTPVIASDAASIPEVLRMQALYFKSDNKEELKNILLNLESFLPMMPHELDEYQKKSFRFDSSAKRLLCILDSSISKKRKQIKDA